MNEDTSISLPPPVATEELVDANAPKMKPPQKMMYSEDGLKGASFIEKLSKNVVSTPFVPCILDATAPEHVTETLTPAGIDEAFAVVERRRQDLELNVQKLKNLRQQSQCLSLTLWKTPL